MEIPKQLRSRPDMKLILARLGLRRHPRFSAFVDAVLAWLGHSNCQ